MHVLPSIQLQMGLLSGGQQDPDSWRNREAAEALIAILNENKIDARQGPPGPRTQPHNALVVVVGPNPFPRNWTFQNIPLGQKVGKVFGHIFEE